MRELDQLRKKVKELTLRLEREAKARKLDARLAAVPKKAREQLTRESKALREQGRKLASQLKSTLGDAGKREQALQEARVAMRPPHRHRRGSHLSSDTALHASMPVTLRPGKTNHQTFRCFPSFQ